MNGTFKKQLMSEGPIEYIFCVPASLMSKWLHFIKRSNECGNSIKMNLPNIIIERTNDLQNVLTVTTKHMLKMRILAKESVTFHSLRLHI